MRDDEEEVGEKTLDWRIEKELAEVLKETKESKTEGLRQIRLWLSQTNINARTDDESLLKFLRACKYDLDRAKKKLSCYYKLRATLPQWFHNRDPNLAIIQQLLTIGVFVPLLERDASDRLVVVIRACSHQPSRHTLDDVFKTGLMVLDLMLHQTSSVASVIGLVAIFDLQGVSIGHARQLTVATIRNAVHSWQDCYPVRVKSLDFFNTPSYVNVILNIFRRFMNPKIKERVHVHGYSLESLHKSIGKEILPTEYGGTAGDLQTLKEHWLREVTGAHSWYQEDEKYKAEI